MILHKQRHQEIDTQDLLDHVDLRSVFGDGFIRCPFHEGDNTPSLKIYERHFYCYGCGQHGDGIDLVQKIQGIGFVEAVQYLEGFKGQKVVVGEKKNLDPIPGEIVYAWVKAHTPLSLAYLHTRGITNQFIHLLNLGFTGRAISIPYIANNLVENVRFRVLPEFQMNGENKYTSYKGRSFPHLYPHDLFQRFFGTSNFLCLTEGAFDAILLLQAGIAAMSVPSITTDLRSFAPFLSKFYVVYILYDMDDAGQRAAQKLMKPSGKTKTTLSEFLGTYVQTIQWNPEWGKDVTDARTQLIPMLKNIFFGGK